MEVLSHYELAHYFLPLSNLFDHKFILHFVFVALLSLYVFLTHSKPHDQIKILEFIPHIAFPPLSFTLFSYYEQFTIFGNYLFITMSNLIWKGLGGLKSLDYV